MCVCVCVCVIVSPVQVSLSGVGEDKFSRLLRSTHNTLSAVLEVHYIHTILAPHTTHCLLYWRYTIYTLY